LFCCFSCKEENSKKYTQVKVNVSNYVSGLPIEDITCVVYEQDALGNSTLLNQASTFDGVFEYNFLAKKNKSYFMTCSIDLEKYKMIQFFQYVDLDKYQMNEFNFELVKYASLNMNYYNSSCENGNDELRYRYYFKNPYGSGYIYIYSPYWDGELSKKGCISQIGVAYHQVPAGTYTIEWNVTRDSGYSEGSDTFFVGNGDSLTYLLEY
jgi:hypothetical protein